MTADAWHDDRFVEVWDEAGNIRTNPDRLNQLVLLADMLAMCGPKHILDLGIGSAQVELAIKNRHPEFFDGCQVTGIDASEAMLARAQKRCCEADLTDVRLIQRDFASLQGVDFIDVVEAVICVQALHEVDDDVKQSVFRWVREKLPIGYPFFILDRFDYSDLWSREWHATWNWMRSKVSAEVMDFEDYHNQYRAKTDHISSVENYRGWLEAAGFSTVCPYQCFNRALIIAR